jgi:Anti-sigma-K factor rskA
VSNSMHPADDLENLIAGRILGDLTADEELEVVARDSREVEIETERLETVAAAIQLAFEERRHAPLPKSLYDKIIFDAGRQLSQSNVQGGLAGKHKTLVMKDYSLSRREIFAWLCMAASLLVAFGLMYSGGGRSLSSVASKRARLLKSETQLIRVAWAPGKTPFAKPVSGDVVWSNERQEGYMRFTNLPINDPTKEQYQLWIIDPSRDDEPIDGGVFDVNSDGEVVIEIQEKLKVISPKAFAITIEKPGGVVVSTQEKLPLLAPVP